MAPKKRAQKRVQNGGDELDTKLQHAVTTLNELAASLSAILESRGVPVPEADAPAPAAEPAVEETKTEDAASEDAPADENKAGGGKKKTAKKAAPKKK